MYYTFNESVILNNTYDIFYFYINKLLAVSVACREEKVDLNATTEKVIIKNLYMCIIKCMCKTNHIVI